MATSKPTPRKASTVTDSDKSADEKPSNIASPSPIPADVPAETSPAPTRHAADEGVKANEAEDVEALLTRHTFDGKGDNAVPPESFRGFSAEGVEKKDLKPTSVIVDEIIAGHWGSSPQVVVERLHAAGYAEQLNGIEQEYNLRKLRGAPSTF